MPYWRLSSFYFFYFASLGVLVPFWPIYLNHQHFNALEIAQLAALVLATKIIAPNIWGFIGDHTGKRLMLVRSAALLSLVFFSWVFFVESFWGFVLVMGLFSFFWNAALPQFEVITLNFLGGAAAQKYTLVRLWGSVGFIVAVSSLGILLEWISPLWIPVAVVLLFLGMSVSSFYVPPVSVEKPVQMGESFLRILLRPQVMVFFLACILLQMSHGPYYVFYSLYMAQQDYPKSLIGVLWSLGVMAEIIMFIFLGDIIRYLGLKVIFITSIAVAVLRWLLIAYFAPIWYMQVLAQLLHAATFGSYHAAAIQIIHGYFPGKFQGRGQALYSSMSFGLGGAMGSLISGYLWVQYGPEVLFLAAAGIATLALLLVLGYLRGEKPQ